ncbi:MAG: outer membrane lipoprotein carrier protein LolA [Proteobacteria bacterium]|nr:outer membrane lipoprotein carrier protein LolA [Pseudomonadota bacterium]
MRKTFKSMTSAVFLLVICVVSPNAWAELNAEDKAQVARIEAYLNSLNSMQARFLQLDAGGGVAIGDVYMRRPGRMRFEYEPPAQILVVADGTWLVFRDNEIKETTRLPLFSTPVSVLLQEVISLSGDVTVTKVENDSKALRVTVVDTENPDEGSITLVFSDEPLQLRQWLVTDAQGAVTSISISNLQKNVALRNDLFTFFDSDYE